jgi:hypothetical protein
MAAAIAQCIAAAKPAPAFDDVLMAWPGVSCVPMVGMVAMGIWRLSKLRGVRCKTRTTARQGANGVA